MADEQKPGNLFTYKCNDEVKSSEKSRKITVFTFSQVNILMVLEESINYGVVNISIWNDNLSSILMNLRTEFILINAYVDESSHIGINSPFISHYFFAFYEPIELVMRFVVQFPEKPFQSIYFHCC